MYWIDFMEYKCLQIRSVGRAQRGTVYLHSVIDIGDITKAFRIGRHEVVVLDHVSLRVDSGKIAGVIGPSGSGKTTLARCVNLLERPTSGTVTVAGQDLTALAERQLQAARRRIGTIFQFCELAQLAHRLGKRLPTAGARGRQPR
jgi:ABC-type transporter Mla maintaining outer membrane lipid asymmetry ATPase subunit MlaF